MENPAPIKRLSRTPWAIVSLLFLVAVINYFDRQSLAIVAPHIQADLHLSDRGYGHVMSAFLFASAIAYAISGFVCDWLGAGRSMALFVGWWSIAEAATAFVTSGTQLGVARFFLGIGEPGLWVAAPKAVAELMPKEQRPLTIGIYTSGATLGAVIALPIIVFVTLHLPYRAVFVVDGAAGLLWLPFWLFYYRRASGKNTNRRTETRTESAGTLSRIFLSGTMWRLMIARAITDPVWYFYLFWYPKYLLSARHLTMVQIARVGWLVYLGAGIGTIAAGALSAMLMRRGLRPLSSYRWIMIIAACLVPLSPLASLLHGIMASVLIAALIALAHMCWLVTLTAVIVEIFPANLVGRSAGLIAAGSGFGGMASTEIVGWLVSHGGYTSVFNIMAILHPAALIILWSVFSETKKMNSTLSAAHSHVQPLVPN